MKSKNMKKNMKSKKFRSYKSKTVKGGVRHRNREKFLTALSAVRSRPSDSARPSPRASARASAPSLGRMLQFISQKENLRRPIVQYLDHSTFDEKLTLENQLLNNPHLISVMRNTDRETDFFVDRPNILGDIRDEIVAGTFNATNLGDFESYERDTNTRTETFTFCFENYDLVIQTRANARNGLLRIGMRLNALSDTE